MDENYYNKCGNLLLESYMKHCSHVFSMYVYNENDFDIPYNEVTQMGWKTSKEYIKFQKRHKNERVRTFAKKGFSIIHAMKNIKADRLIWFDSDLIITNKIPKTFLDLLSPDDTLSTHYSVWHRWPNSDDTSKLAHSCETGFFILNKNHPGFNDFFEIYANIYYNDFTNGLRRFYDGEVYGKTVKTMEKKGYRMINLNPGDHKTPIPRSVMAPYLNHFKGGAKDNIDSKKIRKEYGFN